MCDPSTLFVFSSGNFLHQKSRLNVNVSSRWCRERSDLLFLLTFPFFTVFFVREAFVEDSAARFDFCLDVFFAMIVFGVGGPTRIPEQQESSETPCAAR